MTMPEPKRPRGRPKSANPKAARINVRLTPEQFAKLLRFGATPSAAIVRLIDLAP